MIRKRKTIFLICGILLALTGWLLVEKRLLSIPEHFSYYARLDVSIDYFDTGTGQLTDTATGSSQIEFQSFPAEGNQNTVSASLTTWKQNGAKLAEKKRRYLVEHQSWITGNGDNAALLFAPREAPPHNFLYKHISLPKPTEMRYEEMEVIEKLLLVRYSGQYSSKNNGRISSGDFTIWFEPASGYPVKYREEKRVYQATQNGKPVLQQKIQSSYPDIVVNNHIREARYYKQRITVASFLGPLTVIISLVLLVSYAYSIRTFGWLAAALAALTAVSAFAAWLPGVPTPSSQAFLAWFPMEFDIALAVLLSSLTLLFIATRHSVASRFCATLALALSLAAISEYATGLNLRLNLLPIDSDSNSIIFQADRTSLNSAICLFAFSFVLLGHTFKPRPYVTALNTLLLSGIFAYALIAYLGHLIGLEGTYAWSDATSMTTGGAGAILLLVLAYATIGTPGREATSRHHFSFSIVTIGIVISVVLWLALIQEERGNIEEAMEMYASKFHQTLVSEISQRESAIKRKAARWATDRSPPFRRSTMDAKNYFEEVGGYELFVRLDSERNPIWTYPENYSSKLVEKLADVSFSSILNQAKAEKRVAHSGLFTVSGNKHVTASAYSLWRDQDFYGYFVGLISISTVLEDVVRQYAGEMDIQVKVDQSTVHKSNSPFTERSASHTRDFHVQWNNLDFSVTLIPTPSYLNKFYTALPLLVLGAGISLSFLTGITAWLYRERNSKLEEVNNEIKARKTVQKRLENLISHSPNGILLVSKDGEIKLANDAVRQMFGYTNDELIDKSIDFLIPQQFRLQHGMYLSKFLKEPSPRKMGEGREVFGMRKSGEEFPVEIGLAPTEHGGEIQIICSIVDISKLKSSAQQLLKTQDALMNLLIDTKQAQIELENKQNELKATNKELEQFAYIASHDLQEPLRKLISFSKLLPQDIGVELSENARKDLFFIQDAAERMRSLVQDLLTLSRAGINALSISECDLDTVVDDVLSVLSSAIEESEAEISRVPLPKIQCDRRLITQLYQNLISNALKFVPPGAKPKIELTLEKRTNGEQVFGVKDNGIGIKPHHRERIFMPFKRLHSAKEYKGTGIGLSICKKAVERHGGTIWVESGDNGTHFKFTLGKSS